MLSSFMILPLAGRDPQVGLNLRANPPNLGSMDSACVQDKILSGRGTQYVVEGHGLRQGNKVICPGLVT